MTQSTVRRSLTVAAWLIIGSSAGADVVGWGAETRNSTFSSCPSFCSGSASTADGGEGETSAAATENTFGTSRGDVHLKNPSSTFLPILKAEALASTSGGALATVTGVQGFTYIGRRARTITLNLELDVFLDRTAPGTPEASARSDVAVFFTNNLLPFVTDFNTVRSEVGADAFRGDESTMRADVAPGTRDDVSVSDTISFDVMPGDEFLVWAGLRIFAERGGIADVFDTFTLGFDDDAGLIAASAPDIPAGWLDDFMCYGAKGRDNLDVSVDLEDEFGFVRHDVGKPEFFCNPVDTNGEGIFDDTAHLTGYKLHDDDEDFDRRTVTVSNLFGDEQVLVLKKPGLLLVPSEMNGIASDLNLDFFKCYKVKHRGGVDVDVSLEDRFNNMQAGVEKPELFCNAVDRNGEGIIDDTAHLTCYDIKSDNTGEDVYVINRLPDNQVLALDEPEFLCESSELLSIDDDDDSDSDTDSGSEASAASAKNSVVDTEPVDSAIEDRSSRGGATGLPFLCLLGLVAFRSRRRATATMPDFRVFGG